MQLNCCSLLQFSSSQQAAPLAPLPQQVKPGLPRHQHSTSPSNSWLWCLLETPGSLVTTWGAPSPATGNVSTFLALRIINEVWLSALKAQKEKKENTLKSARTFYNSSAGFMEINVCSTVPVPDWEHQEKRTPIEASIKASRATLNKIRWGKPKEIQSHLSSPDPTCSFYNLGLWAFLCLLWQVQKMD